MFLTFDKDEIIQASIDLYDWNDIQQILWDENTTAYLPASSYYYTPSMKNDNLIYSFINESKPPPPPYHNDIALNLLSNLFLVIGFSMQITY